MDTKMQILNWKNNKKISIEIKRKFNKYEITDLKSVQTSQIRMLNRFSGTMVKIPLNKLHICVLA